MDNFAFNTYWQQPPPASDAQLDSINQALSATLNPRIPNHIRQQALEHLEQVKQQPDAPHSGFTLADDWKQNDAVRYYGLQLLEHAVRYRWNDYTAGQTEQLRTWVKCLAGSLREQDALFLRKKIAQLWAEVAKRCWGDAWMDMDVSLVKIWTKTGKGVSGKVFVLGVLEQLSEEIMNGDDAVAGLRGEVLGACLNEAVVPREVYTEFTRTRGERLGEVRCGDEGWLARICGFFAECVKEARVQGGEGTEVQACAVRALNALRPTLAWVSLVSVVEVGLVDCLFLPFHSEDVALQSAATEVLYALLVRPYNAHSHETWSEILQQAMRPDRIAMIRHTFQHTSSAPGEDDAKYTLQKKLAEVLSLLADTVALHPSMAGTKVDLPSFFDLLILVLQSKSFVVSIPILHSWSKMMSVQEPIIIDIVLRALGTLIQTCSERLLRYEALSNDVEDEVVSFLDEDFDTVPERHAFLGNYRRYCVCIIQAIARSKPLDALSHVLEQMRTMVQNGPYTGGRGFDPGKYSRSSMAVLRFDAQFNVVSSALKGFSLWCHDVAALPAEDALYAQAERDRASAAAALQEWCYAVINLHVDDPEVAAQLLQTQVLVLRTVDARPEFVLHVVQHLLTMRLYDDPAHHTFSEAVKSFEALRVVELQKLAVAFADELLEVYHELEPRVGVLVDKSAGEARLVWGYRAFLFMIVQRAKNVNEDMRKARLEQMLRPVFEAWRSPGLTTAMESLQTFCTSMGMGDLPEFYKQYHFDQVQDWSAQQLDEAGQARQADIKDRREFLPLRMTKSMLAASTEKLKPSSGAFDTACALWSDVIPVVLPNLLQMLRHAQAYHNMANWSHLPDELQSVIRRTLLDRFWQSGISNESKDDFYARISGSKHSYEGFASVVRGVMRNIREGGYHILYLMTKFEEQFYGLGADLAEPLGRALFDDAECLSANHVHPIISLMTALVQRCPPHHRRVFLTPLLVAMFTKLDAKISSEWATIGDDAGERDGELGDEMRVESVLRQLTFSMVTFVPFLLESDKPMHTNGYTQGNGNGNGHATQTLSDLVLFDPTILEPMILFCTHALRMHDSRCCTTICKVFRGIIPVFTADTAPSPQVRTFISTEVLKACITSLNEPYFADTQKDLASLIAQILLLYAPKTSTPIDVLLSLPDMPKSKVEKAVGKLLKAPNERQQRALVLDLLEGVRGVSIHEAGKIAREAPKAKKAVAAQYMEVEARPVATEGDEQGLDGVAGLFAE